MLQIQGEGGYLQGILPYAQLQTIDRGQVFTGCLQDIVQYITLCVLSCLQASVGYIALCVIMFTS